MSQTPSIDMLSVLQKRYTAKVIDESRPIPPEIKQQLIESLRLSPSSVNSQPWHFILAESKEGRDKVAKSTEASVSMNTEKIRKAPMVVILCSLTELSEEHRAALVAQEEADGRYEKQEDRERWGKARPYWRQIMIDRENSGGLSWHWMEKQTYIASGFLLLTAAALGVDATIMEGFDPKVLDEELDLKSKGLHSSLIITLGYHSPEDRNATAPKSRLSYEKAFTTI